MYTLHVHTFPCVQLGFPVEQLDITHPSEPEDHDTDRERCEYMTNEIRAALTLEAGCELEPAPDGPGPLHPEDWPDRIAGRVYCGGFVRGFSEEKLEQAHEAIQDTLEAFCGVPSERKPLPPLKMASSI